MRKIQDHKTDEEKEFDLPPLSQMNDMVLDLAIKYAHEQLRTEARKNGDTDRVERKIRLLERERVHRNS